MCSFLRMPCVFSFPECQPRLHRELCDTAQGASGLNFVSQEQVRMKLKC